MFSPRLEILPPAQRLLWPRLYPVLAKGFVLYRGTAIALRLGHRVSVDFDFFTERLLDKREMRLQLLFLGGSIVLQESANGLTVMVPVESAGEVKVSFFGSLDFGRVGSPDVTEDGVMRVASLEDLMATKLKVVLDRVEAKDYVDIAALLKAGASLTHGMAAARALYGQSFQASESLKALVYFEGGDLENLTLDQKQLLIEAVSHVETLPDMGRISHTLS